MKPYQQVLIQECDEPLVPIPLGQFSVVTPHPYEVLGAPYGDRSSYWLRQTVLHKLKQAQATLQTHHPGWRIQIFDAYRPIAVQQFMVDYTARTLAQADGISLNELSEADRQALFDRVYQFWALPSHNPNTPPPHSTGAAIDITLVDASDTPIEMGSPIDEASSRSHPNHFQDAQDAIGQLAHQNRCLLRQCLEQADFQQHPNEWWHFSYGDQLWAWSVMEKTNQQISARYACADRLVAGQ